MQAQVNLGAHMALETQVTGLGLLTKWRKNNLCAVSKRERTEVLTLAKTITQHFNTIWNGMLTHLKQWPKPAMMCYMSDGWSRKVWQRLDTVVDGKRVQSCGRVTKEMLLERAMLKVLDGDTIRACIHVSAPRQLTNGKTAFDIFSCMNEFERPLRMVNRGPCLNFNVWDGMHFAALLRLAMARQRLFYEAFGTSGGLLAIEDGSDQPVDNLAELTDFTLGMRCMSHIFSLCTRWGLSPWCSQERLDCLHISIKSLSNCGTDLIQHIEPMVSQRLAFYSMPTDFDTIDSRHQYWNLMVQDPVLAQRFCDIGFWYDFDAELILVDESLETCSGVVGLVSGLIQSLFHWHHFSETRWLAVRDSARAWLATLSVGLDLVFKLCRDDSDVSMYLLSGHSKGKSAEVRYYAALACVSPLISESAAAVLLEDDRFLANNASVMQAMQEEQSYVISLRPAVWTYMLRLIGGDYTDTQLRSDAMCACRRSFAFAYKDAFRQLSHYPFSLTQGSIEKNLEQLVATPSQDIKQPFALQLHLAIQCGMPMESGAAILRLAKDGPCCTNMVEQSHGIGAQSMLVHRAQGESSLFARMLIGQAHAAFVPSEHDKILKRFDSKIQKLEKCIGKRFGAGELLTQKIEQASPRGCVRKTLRERNTN
jgi:hypothetical protein